LIVLGSNGQEFYGLFFNLGLFYVFLIVRLGLQVFESNTSEVVKNQNTDCLSI
jgi:hypothetical protein